MKGYDRTITSIFLHIIDHFVGRKPGRIVASDEIPHHYSVFSLKQFGLSPPQPSMWRPEQLTLNQDIGLLHVCKVSSGLICQCRNMVHGMVSYMMSSSFDLLKDISITGNIVSHTKESSPHTILRQNIQHPRSDLGCWTVIKRQIDTFRLRWNAPKAIYMHQAAEYGWGLLNKQDVTLLDYLDTAKTLYLL